MMTKPVRSQIDAAYSGRVNLVVFDFTNGATTARSRPDARKLEIALQEAGSNRAICAG